ncbi:MAG: (E)-4-hydroxy-3-methylbut-2-enyl-diphosphate synthase [Bacteroidetes bacterium]|nr:(E)-4-hydroxy-3-methylbut-2-enyl-diphosphate synthase [Bacteroidota bacterium]
MRTFAPMLTKPYCYSLTEYKRFATREVKIGSLLLGGNNPIRVQSMTTTDTMNTEATVAQSIRMIKAGCELVRITAPSINEAKNLVLIKKQLVEQGYHTPLCADIHFTPNAAEFAARVIEKVRINPGNYADKKKFEQIDYTNHAYEAELDRIRQRFSPLVKICKEYGTAMRIGTNHGSLSDRILSRYGDTPLGMVESALEFLRICEDLNYYNMVISMKASNTQVMVQAYRLLVQKMIETNRNYPLHLGVTEAGDGEDGRIKSAVGIGTLLEDGLGDTIRVSLTEEPELEIPVAQALAKRYEKETSHTANDTFSWQIPYNPYEYSRAHTQEALNIGGKQVPRIITDCSNKKQITPATFFAFGYQYSVPLDKWNLSEQATDFVFVGDTPVEFELPGTLGLIFNAKTWLLHHHKKICYPFFTADEYANSEKKSEVLNFVSFTWETLQKTNTQNIQNDLTLVLVLESTQGRMSELRRMCLFLNEKKCTRPVIIKLSYKNASESDFQLYAATDMGALLIDGFGDGLWIQQENCVSPQVCNSTAFGILQATRTRISKTEYISCPSCGRTLFDLQETTAKIRAVTDHLKGVKIGIMGCIVNGPGEMADADYGYVGTGPDKISLYKGKEVVKKNVSSQDAVNELIDLIKEHGDWVDRA